MGRSRSASFSTPSSTSPAAKRFSRSSRRDRELPVSEIRNFQQHTAGSGGGFGRHLFACKRANDSIFLVFLNGAASPRRTRASLWGRIYGTRRCAGGSAFGDVWSSAGIRTRRSGNCGAFCGTSSLPRTDSTPVCPHLGGARATPFGRGGRRPGPGDRAPIVSFSPCAPRAAL